MPHEFRSIDIDGVPVFHPDEPVDRDHLTAVLMFRVGLGDEPLNAAGITHVIQHLVMSRLRSSGIADPHSNASVDLLITQLRYTGRTDEVAGFLRDVCQSIGSLDLSRLGVEQQVIHAEADRRGYSVLGELATWRYGVAGPGRLQWQDLGVSQLAAGPVASWAAESLTTGNAALFLSGPPPPGLELTLPPGPRRDLPTWPQVRPTPAWFPLSLVGRAAISAVIDGSTAATAYANVLAQRLRAARLLSYEQGVQYIPLGPEQTMIVVFADHAPYDQQRLADALGVTFRSMAQRAASPAELDAWLSAYSDGSGRAAALALAAARDTLLGSKVIDDDELRRRVDMVTPDDILDVAEHACRHALYAVPKGVYSVGHGVEPVTPSGTSPIGRPTNPWHVWWSHDFRADRGRLYVSDVGVGLFRHDTHTLSVRWRSCAAMVRWADGGRALVTHDGAVLPVEPTMWARGAKLTALLDERVPADRHIRLPAREQTAIPHPTHRFRRWQRHTTPSR